MQIPAHVRSAAVPAALEAFGLLTPTLRRYPKTRKAVTYFAAAQTAYKALNAFRAHFSPPAPETWTVTVKADEATMYEHALAIMSEHVDINWRRVEAEMTEVYEDRDDDGGRYVYSVLSKPASNIERHFMIDGHPVCAYVDVFKPPIPTTVNGVAIKNAVSMTPRRPAEAIFETQSAEGQKAVLNALQARLKSETRSGRSSRKPRLFTSRAYGGWERAGDLPIRPVASVAVTDNQVQRIVDDINLFRENEDNYVRRGIPFHRGYLLWGPPGTGKTSAVKAIAHAVGADLYSANLGTLNDSGLAELVQGVSSSRNPAVLLLEDIDSFDAARDREDKDHGDFTGSTAGISTTGLLNALDGVETPHGLVTILTSNHPEALDEALMRPGRVDQRIHFGNPDDATVMRHFEFFFERPPSVQLYAAGRSGAELNEVFISNMTDADAAEAVLRVPVKPDLKAEFKKPLALSA